MIKAYLQSIIETATSLLSKEIEESDKLEEEIGEALFTLVTLESRLKFEQSIKAAEQPTDSTEETKADNSEEVEDTSSVDVKVVSTDSEELTVVVIDA